MNMEQNKILAALLIAGITAYFGGFVADIIYHKDIPEKNAYYIDVPETPVEGGPIVVATADPITDLMAEANVDKGKKLSRACAACHTFEQGGGNGIGPNLWKIYGATKGRDGEFAYSDALKEFGGNWDEDSLNKFLWKPKKYMPGTKMNYIGIRKAEDRAAVVKWLQTLK